MNYTDTQIDAANEAYATEFSRWSSVAHLPARNGMSIEDWMKTQQSSTYDLIHNTSDGPTIVGTYPDALHKSQLFIQRDRAAMRSAAATLHWDESGLFMPPLEQKP